MNNRTTIQIKRETRELLKKARRFKRETYEDQIKRMLKKEGKI